MRLKVLFESIDLGSKVNASAYRSGSVDWSGDIFMHFGSKEAAEHAARGQDRKISKFIINLDKTAVLKDSKAAHDQRPDKLAEDLVAGGTFTDQIIGYVKQVMDKNGVSAAFALIKKALKNKGYDGISYINANEDPGSTSYILWDPYKARRVYAPEEIHTKAEQTINQLFKQLDWKGWTNWSYSPQIINNIFNVDLYGEKSIPQTTSPEGFHDEDQFAGGSSVGCTAAFDFNKNVVTIAPMASDHKPEEFDISNINGMTQQVRRLFFEQ